jgi:hypothetical protein
MALEAPWVMAHRDEDHINFRYGDSSEGVRVQLQSTETWQVGVTPIHGGRPYQRAGMPMVSPPVPPLRVAAEAQGPDLVIRLYGPPLQTLTSHPEAPEDPVITWVRLRPRGESWRIVLDGVGSIVLEGGQVTWTGTDWHVARQTPVRTSAKAWRSALEDGWWFLDVAPAVQLADPYPRTAWTWTPAAP